MHRKYRLITKRQNILSLGDFCLIPKLKVKDGLGLDVRTNSDFSKSELQPLTLTPPCPQGKALLRPLITNKVVNIRWEDKTKKTIKTREYIVKELFHFVDWYHQLPEEPLLKWIVKIINLGVLSLVLNAAEWESIFGLMQDPQLTVE